MTVEVRDLKERGPSDKKGFGKVTQSVGMDSLISVALSALIQMMLHVLAVGRSPHPTSLQRDHPN